jgi:hypothetical protein
MAIKGRTVSEVIKELQALEKECGDVEVVLMSDRANNEFDTIERAFAMHAASTGDKYIAFIRGADFIRV